MRPLWVRRWSDGCRRGRFFMKIFRQNILVTLWVFVTAVAMIGWLTGLSWAAARMIERLFS